MKAISKKFLVFVLSAFSLTVFASAHNQLPPGASHTQNLLDSNIGNIHFDNASAPFIFNYALIQAAVPGGIVDVSGCPNGPKPVYSFAFADARLRDVLEAIAKHDPLDRWTVENGVVNLLPVKGTPALLDTRIGKFDSKDAATPNEAASLLAQSPEVEQAEKRLGLKNPFHIQVGLGVARKYGSPIPKPRSPLALHLRNVTFLDALNALVRAKGSGVWMYREWHCSANNGYSVTFSE